MEGIFTAIGGLLLDGCFKASGYRIGYGYAEEKHPIGTIWLSFFVMGLFTYSMCVYSLGAVGYSLAALFLLLLLITMFLKISRGTAENSDLLDN